MLSDKIRSAAENLKYATIKKQKLGVDAGNISIVDVQQIADKYKIDRGAQGMFIPASPGTKAVGITIHNAWHGDIKVPVTRIKVTGNEIYVGDLAYLFADHDEWLEFLKETDYMDDLGTIGKSFDTGGDGEFLTEVKI